MGAVLQIVRQGKAVTPSSGFHGGILPSTTQIIKIGLTSQFTLTPASGYAVSEGGTCGGILDGNLYTTSIIAVDCTVEATFLLDVDGDGIPDIADNCPIVVYNQLNILWLICIRMAESCK